LVAAAENYQALSDKNLKACNPCLFVCLAINRTAGGVTLHRPNLHKIL